jgi:hypothetical protein
LRKLKRKMRTRLNFRKILRGWLLIVKKKDLYISFREILH